MFIQLTFGFNASFPSLKIFYNLSHRDFIQEQRTASIPITKKSQHRNLESLLSENHNNKSATDALNVNT